MISCFHTVNYDSTLPITRQRRNSNESSEIDQDKDVTLASFCMIPGHQNSHVCNSIYNSTSKRRIHFCPEFIRAVENVHYIVESIRNTSAEQEVKWHELSRFKHCHLCLMRSK